MASTASVKVSVFLSTPSARRATTEFSSHPKLEQGISIHALREEGDFETAESGRGKNISIHALREEGDAASTAPRSSWPLFLSTPSARRATRSTTAMISGPRYFYPRPPRGGRPEARTRISYLVKISIHALREEGDPVLSAGRSLRRLFLSTPSARRATAKTERKPSVFVSLYTSLHKLQRGVCKASHKITPLLAKTAGIPVRSVPENHVRFLFALAGHHPDIKRSAHYPAQTPGAVQRARP